MADSAKEPVVKAYVIGRDYDFEKAEQTSDDNPGAQISVANAFKDDVLAPPHDPAFFCRLYEHANSLRQNIDAYKTNIDGFGHVFEPIIELREAGARDLITDAIYLERADQVSTPGSGITALEAMLPPDDKEIDQKISDLRYFMRLEKARAESFFDHCCVDESFVSLRRKTREDMEVTGNGYWEVIRNDASTVSQFVHVPSRSVRVLKQKSKLLDVKLPVRVGTLKFQAETYRRRFRRYVQQGTSDDLVYFKEFGDPTCVSSKTGKDFADLAQLQSVEGEAVQPANEIFHFKIHSVRNGAYGAPRWIGNLLSVLGSRSAEEVNFAYFENKSIPPIAILVSGGKLGEESVKRIESFVETQIKGKKNFHKILVIEAETTMGSIGLQENAGQMRIEIKQLTDAQLKDGIFLQYDAANMDKVGMGFRLPRLLRGDIRDFNRASAEAALDFAESQVFHPERNEFDFTMNRFLLSVLGIKYWRFKSLGPRLSDAKSWGEMIVALTVAGILTPQDAREIAGKKVLSHELPVIKADWVNQPLTLTIAGVGADVAMDGVIPAGISDSANPANLTTRPTLADAKPGTTPSPTLMAAAKARIFREAKKLLDLRDAFREQEAKDVVARYQEERKAKEEDGDGEELIISMTAQEMAAKFGITKT